MEQFDVVVIGAGAAGMMCAAEAGKRGRRCCCIDHAAAPARRSASPAAGAATSPTSTRQPAELPVGEPAFLQLGAGALHAARLHRPGRAARHRLAREDAGPAVLRRLGQADHRHAAGRDARRPASTCSCRPPSTGVEQPTDGFPLATGRPQRRLPQSLVVATGGMSIPKMGATGFGYEIARQFGLRGRRAPGRRWCR